jgi:hypothetical protein
MKFGKMLQGRILTTLDSKGRESGESLTKKNKIGRLSNNRPKTKIIVRNYKQTVENRTNKCHIPLNKVGYSDNRSERDNY